MIAFTGSTPTGQWIARTAAAGPFGGFEMSGLGRELGVEGLDAFRETKHRHIDWLAEPKPWWHPYGRA